MRRDEEQKPGAEQHPREQARRVARRLHRRRRSVRTGRASTTAASNRHRVSAPGAQPGGGVPRRPRRRRRSGASSSPSGVHTRVSSSRRGRGPADIDGAARVGANTARLHGGSAVVVLARRRDPVPTCVRRSAKPATAKSGATRSTAPKHRSTSSWSSPPSSSDVAPLEKESARPRSESRTIAFQIK